MESEEVFQYIGDIGLYQGLLYLLVGICGFLNGVQNIGINFAAAAQDHWCRVPQLENFPHDVQKYVAVPHDGSEYDSCSIYDIDYDRLTYDDIINWNRSNLDANMTTRSCDHGWVYDQSKFVSTINSKFDLVCGRSWMSQFVSTGYYFGVFVGSALSGIISDRFGRHKPLLIGNVAHLAFVLGEAFAPNYPVFVVMRFLTPLASYTAFLSSFVIVMEFIGIKYRTLMGVMFQGFFSFGIMVVSGIGYAVRDQRNIFIVTGCMVAVTFSFIWIVPESPRWLISKGRYAEAEKILRKAAIINGRTFPDDIKWTGDLKKGSSQEDLKSDVTLNQVCRSPILCRELGLMYLNWFTTSMVYYGISLNAGAFGGLFLNTFLSGLIELPAQILCWIAMDRGSKRFANAGCLLVAGSFCISCVPVILLREDLDQLLLALTTIGKGAITFSYSSVYLYSAEMFPTSVRHKAVGTSSMFARIGSMASPYMGPPLEDIWRPLPSMIFGCVSLFTGCMVFMLPDTKGHILPDTIEEAEYIGTFRINKDKLKKSQMNGSDMAIEVNDEDVKKTRTNLAFNLDEQNADDTMVETRF